MGDYNRRLGLALIDLLVILKDEMVRDRRIRQLYDEEFSEGYDYYESSRSDEICAWRTRDHGGAGWDFRALLWGGGERMGMAGNAYAYAYLAQLTTAPLSSMAPPPVPREVKVKVEPTPKSVRAVPALPRESEVEQPPKRRVVPALSRKEEVALAAGRREIRKRRVKEPRFGVNMRFEMDDACVPVRKGRQGVLGGPMAGWGVEWGG
ncbi:hypothetical protein VE02_09122 [Pseudogymnoascus sp. 03VT05]|nr:hypothetical protein VE02_09122 [Pseudogymnoascus sp. 03VT05]